MFTMKKGHRSRLAFMDRQGKQDGPRDKDFREPDMEGFDRAAFEKSESALSAARNRVILTEFRDEMDPGVLAYWESHGVRKELFDAEVNDGKGKYSIHTPLNLDAGKKYPLVYYSHGGAGTPYQAETAGFSLLIAKEQFMAVYPFNGGFSNEEAPSEFLRILEVLKVKKYPVDWSRVYVSGYSSGSDATESIATIWPELIAAAAPCPGSNAMYNSLCRMTEEAYEKCKAYQVPLLCVGGTMDFGDRYPFPDRECYENFNIWMEKICKVREYQPISFEDSRILIQETEDRVKKAIGVDFHHTWIEHFEGRDWLYGEYDDSRMRPVSLFICGDGVPHITTGCHASLVWNWMKQWHRDLETGELVYTPTPEEG